MTVRFAKLGWALAACLAGTSCMSDSPAPVLLLNVEDEKAIQPAPDLPREARLVGALETYCIDPLPEPGDIRRAIASTGWRAPAPDVSGQGADEPGPGVGSDAGFGKPLIRRNGEIGGLSLSVGLFGSDDTGGKVLTCAIETANVETGAFLALLRRRGHIEREPIIDMSAPPQSLRAWHLRSRRNLEANHTLSLETDAQDSRIRVAISD